MATRAATFTAKIRNLKDYHSRIANSVLPLPNGTDIANTLKYFSQTLIGVLKDVPSTTEELFVRRHTHRECLQVFPDLDYLHLYETVVSIIEVVPFITTGQHALGESLLGVVGCLAPFLSSQILDTLPGLVASALTSFPTSLHRDILMLLCTNLLPITLKGTQNQPTYAIDSVPSILMVVFQFTSSKEYHSMVVECLMSLKKNVFVDLLHVIAYGTSASKASGVHLLFYYWPQLNPIHFDKTGLHGNYIGFEFAARSTILCQKGRCLNNRCVAAIRSCLDPRLIQDTAMLPIHMCQLCVEELSDNHLKQLDVVVRRVERMELFCENEECHRKNLVQKVAVCTCFSVPCILFNDQRPMRLCEECHLLRHDSHSNHIFHLSPPMLWAADNILKVIIVDSIVSLLKEAENLEDKRSLEMGGERGRSYLNEDVDADQRKILSRYGVWMLVQLVPIKSDISFEVLGHLLSALFHWFDATTYLKDNVVGDTLSRLKLKYVCPWLERVLSFHGDVVAACLLPHPLECFKVARCYDALSSRTLQIKEGLNQLTCLVPFNIITTECWNYILPFWLEAIRSEVPEQHMLELKILLRKLFDGSLNGTSFRTEDMFKFVHDRLMSPSHDVKLQTLSWLQILTCLQVFIPITMLVNTFLLATKSIQHLVLQRSFTKFHTNPKISMHEDNEEEGDKMEENTLSGGKIEQPLRCFLLMLDTLCRQIKIQDVEPHKGVDDPVNCPLLEMLSNIITFLRHEINDVSDNLQISLHRLSNDLIKFVVPEQCKQHLTTTSDPDFLECGNLDFTLANLSPHHQLLFNCAELGRIVPNNDCKYLCLMSTNLLCQHTDFLRTQDTLQERQFFQHFTANVIMPGLWHFLTSEQNEMSSCAVSLLIYFITFPFGAEVFWTLVEKSFIDEAWNSRFTAVEKVAVLASSLNSEMIGTNQLVLLSLAHAFYHLIGSLDDINSTVAVQASLLIESLNILSLKSVCLCLEFHFDLMISDRTLILNKLKKLSIVLFNSNKKKNPSIFSWDFFMNKFDILCLEAQIGLENLGEISHLEDLFHSDLLSDYFLEKVAKARLALTRSDRMRSFNKCLPSGMQFSDGSKSSSALQIFSKQHVLTNRDQKKSTCIRHQSTYRASRFGAGVFTNLNVQVCGNLREFTEGENGLICLLQKVVAFNELDRETMHHLIHLLMNQLVLGADVDIDSNKSLNNTLWHLNIFLGYNPSEKAFTVPPYKLRSSVVFNAYLAGLAKVLDRNFKLGTTMLPFSLDVLQYCPSPQRYASDYQPPNYSLWYLEPYARMSWLQCLLIILYKYPYSNCELIVRLIKITINTIDARFHRCKRKEELVVPPSPYLQRNRDTSNVSVGDLENILEIETPPGSPHDVISSPTHGSMPQLNIKSTFFPNQTTTSAIQSPASSRPSSPVLPKLLVQTPLKLEDGWKKKKEDTPGLQQRPKDSQARRIAEYNKISNVHGEFDHPAPFSAIKLKLPNQTLEYREDVHDDSKTSVILNASELLSRNLFSMGLDILTEDEERSECSFTKDMNDLRCGGTDDNNGKHGNSPQKTSLKSKKTRKTGLSMLQITDIPELNALISEHMSGNKGKTRRFDILQKHHEDFDPKQKQVTCSRMTDNSVDDQCPSCSAPLESYDEETISTAIVCLATFIHREPVLAAPLLPNVFFCVSRIAAKSPFLWQSERVGIVVPGNSMSTARQFLRCSLHRLAPNNVFPQLFASTVCDVSFLDVLTSTLSDFSELNCSIALQLILEGLNEMKTLTEEQLNNVTINLSNFLDRLTNDPPSSIVSLFEGFFRKISTLLFPSFLHVDGLFKIIISVLKMTAVSSVKSILEPFSKVLSFAIQNSNFKLQLLMDICSLCGRAFAKGRDKFYLSRCVVTELIQTIRFKQILPDDNFVLLVQMACLDAGGTLGPINIVKELASYTFNPQSQSLVSTNIAECFKLHLSDCIEFIADIHTTNKLKTNVKGVFHNLNEDTLGSHLKVGIAQFVALEFSNGKDGRLVGRFLPWLFHPPPSAIQQGPKEFVDCICHIRILCWLLLGSLMHSAVTGAAGAIVCRPLSTECCGYIADHIMVILTGFTGQSKTSVLHMSSLFHAFMLCQLWTMYCELQDVLDVLPVGDLALPPHRAIVDFWGKVTPGILQLLSHSKVMSEMVNLHFLSVMEALQECNSTVLVKLFSLWVPILRSYHSQLPGHMQVRLQMCQNWRPTRSSKEPKAFCEMLSKWIKRMQFKLSQIEVQSSTATQFYAV